VDPRHAVSYYGIVGALMREWRVKAEQDFADFAADRVAIFCGLRTNAGFQSGRLSLTLDAPVEPGTLVDATSLVIDRELAEVLAKALIPVLLDVSPDIDLVAEVQRLRQALSKSEQRVDALINGIGRLHDGA
jgi:hypothetical protein